MAMAKHHFFLVFLVMATVSGGAPPPTIPPHAQQLNNIIDALIGTGDFNSWANIISSTNPDSFPLSATFFVPSEDARLPLDPFMFPYHIVPQRLSFSDLILFKPFSRLPTLLPRESILITNNSAANFTVDNVLILQPDLYLTSNVAVHGINSFLDYSVYGGNNLVQPPPPSPLLSQLPLNDYIFQEGQVVGGVGETSDAVARSCVEFLMGSLAVFGFLVLKIYGLSLGCW